MPRDIPITVHVFLHIYIIIIIDELNIYNMKVYIIEVYIISTLLLWYINVVVTAGNVCII